MRAKKWLVFFTSICSIGTIALIALFKYTELETGYDISLAIFGSALLGFVMSLIEYFSERRGAMEVFWTETINVLTQYRKAKPLVLSEPEELVLSSLSEDESNKLIESYGEAVAKSLGFEKVNRAKEAYIAWLEGHVPMSFKEDDNISEILDEIYKNSLEQDRAQIESVIDNYIELSQIRLNKLNNAYGNLDFLFGNRKIRLKAYNEILNRLREIRKTICEETYHFKLCEEGKGNFMICTQKAIEVSNMLFTSIESESGGLKQECIYQETFDEISESLEDFRMKIYWTNKRDPVDHIPVMGQMIDFGKDDK